MHARISMQKYIGETGGILPQEVLEISYSEIAQSEVIWGQKQSRNN